MRLVFASNIEFKISDKKLDLGDIHVSLASLYHCPFCFYMLCHILCGVDLNLNQFAPSLTASASNFKNILCERDVFHDGWSCNERAHMVVPLLWPQKDKLKLLFNDVM